MKVIDECNCPNCGKKIERQMIRRPYMRIKEIRSSGSASLISTRVRGIYRWVVSQTKEEVKDE